MAGSEWENFGKEIRKTVQDAVENQDYHKLNQTVAETLDRAMGATIDSVSKGMKNARQNQKNMNGAWQGTPYGTYQQSTSVNYQKSGSGIYQQGRAVKPGYQDVRRTIPENLNLYKKTTGAQTVGWILGILGGIAGGGFAILALFMLLGGAVAGGLLSEFGVAATVFAVPAVGFLGMMGYGIKLCGLEKRFRLFLRGLGGREYCNVKELASMIGKSEGDTVKNLKKMIRKGWFRQGHFDESEKCFITSNQMYQEYMRIDSQRKAEAARLEAKRQEEVKRAEDMNSRLSPEARKVIEAGDAFVRKIRACNDAIPGEEISAKISHMEMIVDRIFDRVEQDPDSISDIRKLMDYYLPTTIKLLEAYQELDAQPVAGENIQSSKREIEATLDTLNVAFEKILDDLFHHTAWDVSSDISVLNTMLAQEGLKDDGMKL